MGVQMDVFLVIRLRILDLVTVIHVPQIFTEIRHMPVWNVQEKAPVWKDQSQNRIVPYQHLHVHSPIHKS